MFYQSQHFGLYEYFVKEYGENFSFPAHMHQSYEFITILSGEMEVIVDHKTYTLKKGESLLIFPNQIHTLKSDKSKHMLCIFSPEIIRAYSSKIKGKLPKSNHFSPDKYIITSIDNLNDSSSEIKKKGVLYNLLSVFDEARDYTDSYKTDNLLIHKVFEFIEINYSDECSLERLSKETGLSYTYLSRYFKNTVGMSFNNYVNHLRINKACYLLNNTDNTVLQCSLETGYTSLRSFNRNFKLITGKTPKEYRDSN